MPGLALLAGNGDFLLPQSQFASISTGFAPDHHVGQVPARLAQLAGDVGAQVLQRGGAQAGHLVQQPVVELVAQRVDGAAQSAELGKMLKKAGTKEEVIGFAGLGFRGHAEINRRLGDPTYPATPVVDHWLARVFAK